MEQTSKILITRPSSDYSLIDSGEGEKLERFGKYVLSRPDPQALWKKSLPPAEWKKADGHFTHDPDKGKWSLKGGMESRWQISFGGLDLWIKPTAFKHVGLFPEQESNWRWISQQIQKRIELRDLQTGGPKRDQSTNDQSLEVLNLFGYTGGATLICAQAGAKVAHVDGSKSAIAWARENAEISGLKDKPVRWILDDARDFVRRELKRGRKYAGIIMDPPIFGHGPDSELWKIEEHFLTLLDSCFQLLSDKPLFFLVNGYSAGYSALAYGNSLKELEEKFGGTIEVGELAIEETREQRTEMRDQNSEAKLLPAGIFARWSAE